MAVMLLMLSACSKSNELADINRDTASSKSLEFITEKEKYSEDDTVIRYSITNISDEEIAIAGDIYCFELHIKKDGEWKRVETKTEHFWNELALILNPEQTVNREIPLEDYYNLPLEKGDYRICMESFVSNTFKIY